jgi:hypothetical protein
LSGGATIRAAERGSLGADLDHLRLACGRTDSEGAENCAGQGSSEEFERLPAR